MKEYVIFHTTLPNILRHMKGGDIMDGDIMDKKILVFKKVKYTESKSLAACVTGGGGCACDDGTGE